MKEGKGKNGGWSMKKGERPTSEPPADEVVPNLSPDS